MSDDSSYSEQPSSDSDDSARYESGRRNKMQSDLGSEKVRRKRTREVASEDSNTKKENHDNNKEGNAISTGKRKRTNNGLCNAVNNKNEPSDENDDQHTMDNSDVQNSITTPKSTGETNSKGGKATKPKKRGKKPSSTKTCPRCGKVFKTLGGFKYHMKESVCLGENEGSKRNGSKKKQGVGQSRKKSQETEEDRTCPHCKRVFGSMEGIKYHIEQKVCRRASTTYTEDGKVKPFPTLKAGQQFVTQFGVVEVVKDDRAIPTAILPKDVQIQYVKYKKLKASDEIRETNRYIREAGKLQVRRKAINLLYEKGKANRRSIFDAYFGSDPEHIRCVIEANKALSGNKNVSHGMEPSAKLSSEPSKSGTKSTSLNRTRRNPKIPEDSFPDRIVECILIPDQRSHIVGPNKEFDTRESKQRPTKLYLQRKLLTEPYDKVDRVYYCSDCGQQFTNLQTRKAHCGLHKCLQEARSKKEKREGIERRINKEVEDKIQFPERRKFVKNNEKNSATAKDRKRKWKPKKKKQSSIYPEVTLAMGFKLVQKEKSVSIDIPPETPSTELVCELDNILDNLKGTFKIHQRKLGDQRHGSIYSDVYTALGFKHPRRRKSTTVGNDVGPRKRRRRAALQKPPPPPKPLPPAIDVRALVDEIKSGRYPSFRIFEGEHDDYCVLCKKGGNMYCCEFCKSVEHFECVLKKFTIKEPEPDEDFMCHKCIGIILSRRARAEKRRLRKQANNEMLKKKEAENDPSNGNEYPYMAAQAREVNELVELLKDAQIRLRRSIEATKVNNIRRKVIAGVYPDGYSPPY